MSVSLVDSECRKLIVFLDIAYRWSMVIIISRITTGWWQQVKARSQRARRVDARRRDNIWLTCKQCMHIHPALNYVIVSYVIVDDVIEHR